MLRIAQYIWSTKNELKAAIQTGEWEPFRTAVLDVCAKDGMDIEPLIAYLKQEIINDPEFQRNPALILQNAKVINVCALVSRKFLFSESLNMHVSKLHKLGTQIG